MIQTTVVNHRIRSSAAIPEPPDNIAILNINDLLPEIVARMGEGWRPLSHQIIPLAGSDELILSVLLVRDVEAPDPEAFTGS